MAACNEADTLPKSLKNWEGLNGLNIEWIVVDDRSSDKTGELLDKAQSRLNNFQCLHNSILPEGWLGKVHALHLGIQASQGEWVLCTDADVHFERASLEIALNHAIDNKLDHLAVLPKTIIHDFWLGAAMSAFAALFLVALRIEKLGDPNSQAAVGVGAFNLVKRSLLEKAGGMEWLKLEIADDVGLGLLVKTKQGRSGIAITSSLIFLEWYSSLGQMFKGLEKNLFPVACQYRISLLFLHVTGIFALVLAPWLLLLRNWNGFLPYLGIVSLLFFVVTALSSAKRMGEKPAAALASPIGLLLIALMLIRSGYVCLSQGAVSWRNTRYSISELRLGQRVKLF